MGGCNACGEGSTYPHRLVDGFAVAVAVGIVGVSARLARDWGLALAGSSHCCPAERLHGVWESVVLRL